MRLSLLQLEDDRWKVFWGFHHAILDGWSIPLVLKEVLLAYELHVRGTAIELEPARPYGEYVAWLQQSDMAPAKDYWKKQLEGVRSATPLGLPEISGGKDAGGSKQSKHTTRLSPELTQTLDNHVREQQLTMSTIAQGRWALLLSEYSGQDDVLVGTTVSGRSIDLPGVESMVGMFVNVVPFRVSVDTDQQQPLPKWLHSLKRQHAAMREFEHTPLLVTQQCSEIDRGSLFESILTFENYPVDRALEQQIGGLVVGEPEHFMQTSFPLVLIVSTIPELRFELKYDSGRFHASAIQELAENLSALFVAVASQPAISVADLRTQIRDTRAQQRREAKQQRQAKQLKKLRAVRPSAKKVSGPQSDSDTSNQTP